MSKRGRRSRRERQRRQRRLSIVAGVVVVIAVAAILIVLETRPVPAPVPAGAAARYEGIPQGPTEQGYPRLGEAGAPLQLLEYSSFDCPNCTIFHDEVFVNLLDRVRRGEIAVTYVPLFGTGTVGDSEPAARAALCAHEQGGFWPFHDTMFDWQVRYFGQAFVLERLEAGIKNLGLDVEEYRGCMESTRPGAVLEAAAEDARLELDYRGTPSVFVNGIVTAPDRQSVEDAIAQRLADLEGAAEDAEDAPDVEDAEAVTETPPPTPTELEATPEDESTPEPEATPQDEITPDARATATVTETDG